MSENEPNDPANDPTPEPQDPEPKPSDRTARSEDDPVDWVSEARKWEKQAKANAEAAKKLAELEEAQKTDEQKQQDRLAELESTAKQSTTEAARLRVALRKGLTESQAKRLVGDTEEELEQDADELLATFAPASDDTPGPARRPQERLRPGATPSAEPERSPEELADAVIKRQRGY